MGLGFVLKALLNRACGSDCVLSGAEICNMCSGTHLLKFSTIVWAHPCYTVDFGKHQRWMRVTSELAGVWGKIF